MRIVLTYQREIKSKKGEQYTLLKGLDANGETIDIWLNKAQQEDFGKVLVFADKTDLKDFLSQQPAVEVDFNQQGRLASIERA